jgi:hypothetical protein
LKPGVALSAGGFIKKSISRNSSLSIGLDYQLFTTSHFVGTKDYTTILRNNNFNSADLAKVYKSANNKNYRNYYHFIELPVTLETQLLSGKKPVSGTFGFSLSRLMATNALQYDNKYGFYYYDNGLFHKTQLNVLTGMYTSLFRRSPHPLMIGPQMAYGLTNLLDKNVVGEKHLLFFSIKASMLIKTSR